MKTTLLNLSASAALTFMFSLTVGSAPSTSAAADPALDAVLGLNHPSSCHVIDLLMHNRLRKSMGHETDVLPVVPFGFAGPRPGDLELLEVHLVTDSDGTLGPIFQVSFRNTSEYAVRDFRISIVGVLCRIEPTSPCTMITIPCINAGETKCVEIQLPATAMTMGLSGSQPAPFDTLVVALDSMDELLECNELNNVAILKRGEIGLLVAETPAVTAPSTPAEPEPGATAPPAPSEVEKPSPIGDIDLDELDLGEAEESALRIALETI